MRISFTMFAAAALSLASTEASAQIGPGGNINLQSFRPAMDSRGFITLNASQILGPSELSFGLVTNWGRGMLRLEGVGPNGEDIVYQVQNLITPTLLGAVGLRLGRNELALGLSVPFSVMSGDRDPNRAGENPNESSNLAFDGQGIADLGLHAKLRVRSAVGGRVGFALVGSVYLPTASTDQSWIGAESITPQLVAIVDREYEWFRVAANVGVRMGVGGTARFTDDMRFDNEGLPQLTTNESVAVGATLPVGVGIAYVVSRQRFELLGEVFSEIPIGGENYFPLEALAGMRVYLAQNSFLSLGVGAGMIPGAGGNPDLRAFLGIRFEPNVADRDRDGIRDSADACPDDPEDLDDFEDHEGCPDPDNDQDGIPDTEDGCPNDAEDPDGFEDEDGCPDRDNDNDRIVDEEDKCPNEPETYNTHADEDGCPDRGPVTFGEGKLVVLEKIHFEFDSAVIKPESFPILEVIAKTLNLNPDIELVEVQGHTDQRGSHAYNDKLSQDRAESVVRFLVSKGVNAKRLRAKGYGERELINPAETEEAYAQNRRVAFVIIQQGGITLPQPGAQPPEDAQPEPTPEQPDSAQPAQPAPGGVQPAQPAPGGARPAQPAPGGTQPPKPAPAQPAPGETQPPRPAPAQPAPARAQPPRPAPTRPQP